MSRCGAVLFLLGMVQVGFVTAVACRSLKWNEDTLAGELVCSVDPSQCPEQISYDKDTDQALFQPYKVLYEKITGRSAERPRFYFADLSPYHQPNSLNRIVGICDLNRGHVFVEKSSWEKLGEVQREMLMLHELSHCVAKVRHNPAEEEIERACRQKENGTRSCFTKRPLSLMHPSLFHEDLYLIFKEQYHADLLLMHQ